MSLGSLDAISIVKKTAKLKDSTAVRYYKKPKKYFFDLDEVDRKIKQVSSPRFEILYRIY